LLILLVNHLFFIQEKFVVVISAIATLYTLRETEEHYHEREQVEVVIQFRRQLNKDFQGINAILDQRIPCDERNADILMEFSAEIGIYGCIFKKFSTVEDMFEMFGSYVERLICHPYVYDQLMIQKGRMKSFISFAEYLYCNEENYQKIMTIRPGQLARMEKVRSLLFNLKNPSSEKPFRCEEYPISMFGKCNIYCHETVSTFFKDQNNNAKVVKSVEDKENLP